MNVSIYLQTAYENKSNWTLGENKPNSNPIKPNFRKAKMNANAFSQKDYENETIFRLEQNKPSPIHRRFPLYVVRHRLLSCFYNIISRYAELLETDFAGRRCTKR